MPVALTGYVVAAVAPSSPVGRADVPVSGFSCSPRSRSVSPRVGEMNSSLSGVLLRIRPDRASTTTVREPPASAVSLSVTRTW